LNKEEKMNKKEITEEVIDHISSIVDIADANTLLWASKELEKEADARHEAEKKLSQ